MALISGMIRRAISPSVVPHLLRAIGSSTTLSRCSISASRQGDGSFYQSHSFSSVATDKDSVDANFYGILKQEIKSAESKLKNSKMTPPDSFPFEFEVSVPFRTLELKRKFPDEYGEGVCIEIHMAYVNTSSDDDSDSAHDCDAIPEQDIKAPVLIPMRVRISKDNTGDKYMKFEISVSTDGITINNFAIRSDIYVDQGPKLNDANKELRDYLCKYLEIRGINTDLTRFLLKYIPEKKKETDLSALKFVKSFVKKRDPNILC